ncbi:MAG: HAMP domain-containing histidine kinase [Bryobacterales bacterium]|nr:HAMP domain-containing histidine kinase [Bryobacterales bacterium]
MRLSLLLRIYLSIAIALTALFAVTVWLVQRDSVAALRAGVEDEVRANLASADALWQSRAVLLGAVSTSIASMSDVRAAFGTRDKATIRDTAGEFWGRIAGNRPDIAAAAFVVTDPDGVVLASLGRSRPLALQDGTRLDRAFFTPAFARFPDQVSSFVVWDSEVWQVLLTPVYVDAGRSRALLNVLLAAHPIRGEILHDLKRDTGGDFLLQAGEQVKATTLSPSDAIRLRSQPGMFAIRRTELQDASNKPTGTFLAVRSLDAVSARADSLSRRVLLTWLAAMAVGLALSWTLARRITKPLRELNEAAMELSRENYSVRVPEDAPAELGVLARTFNRMSASIETSRAERIRREQINAIGRLAASVAHDLRNPLAAVLGGAEMLAEFELPIEQEKQTAQQIYKAAQRMQKMLGELSQVGRSRPEEPMVCEVSELVERAVDSQRARAAQQAVTILVDNTPDVHVRCERSRMERVLVNLIGNALEVMPEGGDIRISIRRNRDFAEVEVADSGPGIAPEVRERLFEPFVTAGKQDGLGLGLALSRQTVLDHGGDLRLLDPPAGASFLIRLPAVDA